MDHIAARIEPALERGQWVVSDRYVPSSLAYQGDVEEGDRTDYSWVQQLNARARQPDMTIFLEIDVETSLARIGGRAARDIYETREKIERLVKRYDEVIGLLEAAGQPVRRLDARLPLDIVEAQIAEIVDAL
jgi:dTMP kinase